MRTRLLVFLAAILILLATSGCGGGTSTNLTTKTTQPSTKLASTYVLGEDAPLATVLGFNLTFNSIVLNGAAGSTNNLLAQPETLDFARLIGLRQLMAFNSVPEGTYTSITFQVTSPKITYLDFSTNPPSAKTMDGTWASGVTVNNGVAAITVNLRAPVTLSGSGLVGLRMHFNLRNSLQLDGAGQITGVIDPQIDVKAVHPQDDDSQITDLRGSVASVNVAGNSFVLQKASGKQITISVNSATTYNGGYTLATLAVGMVAEVSGTIQSDGAILATQVDVIAVQHAMLAGPILSVDAAAHTVTILAVENVPAITGVTLQTPVTVDLSNVQHYDIGRIDNWLTAFVFNESTLIAGQRIAIEGTLDTSVTPSEFVAKRVILLRQGIAGTVVANSVTINNGNLGSFQIENTNLIGYILGAPLTVKTSNMTHFKDVDGLSGLAAAGSPKVEVRGLILKDQATGNPVMYAQWVQWMP